MSLFSTGLGVVVFCMEYYYDEKVSVVNVQYLDNLNAQV